MFCKLDMIEQIRTYYKNHPLTFILLCAFAVRLLAVFFAKGYMMHDDHFLTIEPSSSWAAGKNFNDWMPGIGNTREHPEPISFFYLGFLFVFFKIFHLFGIENPDAQMFIMRLIHAAYSLLVVVFAWKITLRISDIKQAKLVAWLLAFIAVIPNFATRNLVEFVCMPPLLMGIYGLLKSGVFEKKREGENVNLKFLLIGSLTLGLAVGFRYQLVLVAFGVGLTILYYRHLLQAILFGVIAFIGFFITQLDDVIFWGGQPFQHLFGYFEYNKTNALNYPGSPFAYLSFISIFILPPVSLFLLFGFVRSWKKYLFLTLPTAIFIVFHIVYPNRQERFLLPILPMLVVAGTIGWNEWLSSSAFWKTKENLHRNLWRFFWVINTIVMMVLVFTYAKKSQVESMLYLYEQGDCKNFIREFSHKSGAAMPPQFYSGNWSSYYEFGETVDPGWIVKEFTMHEKENAGTIHERPVPNYILFYDDDVLQQRVEKMKKYFPTLTFITTIEPGWFDIMLNQLNDKNKLERVHIYKMN